MGGCPLPLRPAQDALQPFRPLGGEGRLGGCVCAAGRGGRAAGGADARCHPRQGAPLGGGRKRGAEAQGVGRSRGGRTTKIHAAVDELGRPQRLIVRPGHRGDAPVAAELVGDTVPTLCLADAAYDSDAFRTRLLARGTTPVIPNNPTRKRKHPFDRQAYRLRNVIERTFCRLKDFRRIATRYDRLARNFRAAVIVAATVIYWL
jgi:transposase